MSVVHHEENKGWKTRRGGKNREREQWRGRGGGGGRVGKNRYTKERKKALDQASNNRLSHKKKKHQPGYACNVIYDTAHI